MAPIAQKAKSPFAWSGYLRAKCRDRCQSSAIYRVRTLLDILGLIARYHGDACVADSGKRVLDGHARLSTRAATQATRCSSRSLVFCPLVFQLLTTIDGTDGANAMAATFTDDTYDRSRNIVQPATAALSINSLPKGCDMGTMVAIVLMLEY
jgi:hypothetical protein